MKRLCIFFITALLALAQTPVRLVDIAGNAQIFGAGGTAGVRYDSGLKAIATSAGTVITASSTSVQAIWCNTTSSTASTITITDGASNTYVDTVAIAANGAILFQFGPVGMKFLSGVTIVAGTAGVLKCQVVGVQ
jgi:hypothetical protein